MKFVIFSLFFCVFQVFVWAEIPLNKKAGVVHIDHIDHIPNHPKGKNPTDQGSQDCIIDPRKRGKKGLVQVM